MSGGFFRGTSADQDTRFSNKQAKLLKSQKFAPELDHLVDMTKVKMDVIRSWIATRATELLGFEDEVLINFVYGLLDGKVVDGKQIQIQITGFMEKNTGKFMKELWGLLLSAQNNASGVPQQFLDAKKEETDKRKAETDRIAQEIQKRKDKEERELEQEEQMRMDGTADKSRSATAISSSVSKQSPRRASSVHPEDDKEVDTGHHSRSKSWWTSPPSRSFSKSFSKSGSYSKEGRKSRSISVSSQSQRYSISPERRYRSPPRRSISSERRYKSLRYSISPRRRHSPRHARSPLRRRSPHTRRRSVFPSRHQSPSPARWRSPYARRRSPLYAQRRSPSPSHRKPPVQVRRRPSPSHHRSAIRRRSLSPARRRSPSPLRRRSPPHRSPIHRRTSLHSPRSRVRDYQTSPRQRKRSRSPYRSQSPSYPTRRSLSREIDNRIHGVESKRYHDGCSSQRSHEKRSPIHLAECPESGHKVSKSRRSSISLRSPQCDSRNQSNILDNENGVTSDESPNHAESPSHLRGVDQRENRPHSFSESPVKQTRRHMPYHDSPETSRERTQPSYARADFSCKKIRDSPATVKRNDLHSRDVSPKEYSSERLMDDYSPASQGQAVHLKHRKKELEEKSEEDLHGRHKQLLPQSPEGIEYCRRRTVDERYAPDNVYDGERSAKKERVALSSVERVLGDWAVKSTYGDDYAVKAEKQWHSRSDEYRESCYETEPVMKFKRKVDQSNNLDTHDSDSEEIDAHRFREVEKRRHKKSDKHTRDLDHTSEYDSEIDDKEANRRRKDEKRLRKEERHRRREERHRRKLDRHAGKLKVKSVSAVTPPSDLEKNHADESDGDAAIRKGHHLNATEETKPEQKQLEIELREKALESLRAKKAISR